MKYFETPLKSQENYKEFGKFMINNKMLYNNILLVKYKKSYAPVPDIKRQNISDDFKEELIYIFDTGQIDYEKLRELSNDENNLFKTLIMKSGLFDKLKYNYNQTRETLDDIIEEYDILKGEIEADNNNPELIKRCKSILKKLFNYGKISQQEFNEIINEL
jgi:hypothetical protein